MGSLMYHKTGTITEYLSILIMFVASLNSVDSLVYNEAWVLTTDFHAYHIYRAFGICELSDTE